MSSHYWNFRVKTLHLRSRRVLLSRFTMGKIPGHTLNIEGYWKCRWHVPHAQVPDIRTNVSANKSIHTWTRNFDGLCHKSLKVNQWGLLTLTRGARRINLDEKKPNRTLYDILGVTSRATKGEIKEAYYKLSMTYHPDRNPDSDAAGRRFQEITDAYDVLGNYAMRRSYDRGLIAVDADGTIHRRAEAAETRDGDQFRTVHQQQHSATPRMRKSPVVGHTFAYNYDNWYQNHYGDLMEQQRQAKVMTERQKLKVLHRQATNYESLFVVCVIFIMICFPIYLERQYDTPVVVTNDMDDEPTKADLN